MFIRLVQLLALAWVASCASLGLQQGSDGFVQLDFDVLKGFNLASALKDFFNIPDLFEREDAEGTGTVSLSNQRAFYVTTIKIGSNNTEVKVLVDTGLSDLWVLSAENPQCEANGGEVNCETYGTFDEEASTTFKSNGTAFSISYADQTYAKGTWAQDDVDLANGFTIKGANFALANDSDSDVGVLGIAYQELESSSTRYSNLPIQLKEQGYIQRAAYSLYLTSAESSKGTILFGGVDHAKYLGELVTLPVSLTSGKYVYLSIPLASITPVVVSNHSDVDGASSSSTPSDSADSAKLVDWDDVEDFFDELQGKAAASSSASVSEASETATPTKIDTENTDTLLDSGTTLSYLPQGIVNSILDQIQPDANYSSTFGGYLVSCTLRQQGNHLTFNFDNKKDIEVPLWDIVLEAGQNTQTGQTICMLGIVPSDFPILGDNFLRSAYTVFDLEENTISLAQMKTSDDTDVEVLT